MENNIKNKVVVITGASSGMGEAAAKHLAQLGATVVLGARGSEKIEKLANEIQESGGKALAIATDVTKRDQVKKLPLKNSVRWMFFSITRASCPFPQWTV